MRKCQAFAAPLLGYLEDAKKYFGINPEDLNITTEGNKLNAPAFLSICKQMMDKFPKAKKVITTLRGSTSTSHNSWSGIMYDGIKMYVSQKYQITDIVAEAQAPMV